MMIERLHVHMSDGVWIAVTVHRPDGETRVPAVMRATRYWRVAGPGEAEGFVDAGMALVLIDVRGTGASFGTWSAGWSRREIKDLAEIVDWLVSQSWCSGNVGAYGTSYDANTALLLAAEGHSAVKTVVPRFFDFDTYNHISHPGGILLAGFIGDWSQLVHALDTGDAVSLVAATGMPGSPDDLLAQLRVDADADGSLLADAFASHTANTNVAATATATIERDPHAEGARQRRAELDQSETFVWAWGSWYDAGTAAGLLEFFDGCQIPRRATLLASSHGGEFPVHVLPAQPGTTQQQPPADQQFAETLHHFVQVLIEGEAPAQAGSLQYWVSGAEEWAETSHWPVNTTRQRLWANARGGLQDIPAADQVTYTVDPEASTGSTTNRWQTQMGGAPVSYDDRQDEDRQLLSWTSSPIEATIRLIGAPSVSVQLSVSSTDAALHAYLEAVSPEGTVHYLTEGHLRLRHRALSPAPVGVPEPYHSHESSAAQDMQPGVAEQVEFTLLPLAVELPVGYRMRLALAGADAGSFARIPAGGPVTWTVHTEMTWIELPVTKAAP